jgi:hypothetical protein
MQIQEIYTENVFEVWQQTIYSTVEPRFKVPRYNGNLDIKEVFVSTEDWWTNFTA